MVRLRRFALVALAVAPVVAIGADSPHLTLGSCSSCHVGHRAPGAGLTNQAGNFTLCNSCHSSGSTFVTGVAGQAIPGTSGLSHRWDALATGYGATPPSLASPDLDEQKLANNLDGGTRLMCSTCHDPHQADALALNGRGKVHASTPRTGLTVSSVVSGATPKAYLLDFVTGGTTTAARFRLSNDNGLSWFGCSGTAPNYTWSAYTGSNGCQPASSVTLNDASNVTVSFSATSFVVGDQWSFYVSYPFLRVNIADAKLCVVCHKDRNMSVSNVQGTGTHQGTGAAITPGTTVMHHPVGPTVVPASMLDANGGAPGTDGNATNDLVLGASGGVTCLTCHRIHKADSNSLTVDQ